MSRCQPVGSGKPYVWQDDADGGWFCTQEVTCLTCNDLWWDDLATDATWKEAMQASKRARAVGASDE